MLTLADPQDRDQGGEAAGAGHRHCDLPAGWERGPQHSRVGGST